MASIFKRGNKWRVQIRTSGASVFKSFATQQEAKQFARQTEADIDRDKHTPAGLKHTFGDLIDTYIEETVGVHASPSKEPALLKLKELLGDRRVDELTKPVLLKFVEAREQEGAGPATVRLDLSRIRTVLWFCGAMLDIEEATALPLVQLQSTRAVLAYSKRIAPPIERDRRPTDEELARLKEYLRGRNMLRTPLWDMILFAIATAMRLGEITRILHEDVDYDTRTIIIRDRKDPKKKEGNHQRVPLLTGPFRYEGRVVDPVEIIRRQGADYRIFPHVSNSVSSYFKDSCDACEIEDLHFHDLRHDAISRLFEAGYQIPEVALVSGHKKWESLRRYTNLKPESLHR